MKTDEIISYHELVTAEKANLQKGMNFGIGKGYSVFLMSVREGAPYEDAIDKVTGTLIYEGHDYPRTTDCPDPKVVDQPQFHRGGGLTENGKFFRAAFEFKEGKRRRPEPIKVYEKIARGIWCYKGFFELVDAKIVPVGQRQVFKFHLMPIATRSFGRTTVIPHTRLIPTPVKLQVWKRDGGKCVRCGATEHLHFDHDIPFSKGGSSIVSENVRLLCARHNLEKSDKIMSALPWVSIGLLVGRSDKIQPWLNR